MTLLRKFYTDPDLYDPVEHIRANLQALFDGHSGYGSFLVDVGLSDMWIEKPDDSHLAELESRIRDQVERWEPRVLVDAMTRENKDVPGRLSLRLQCSIRGSGEVLLVNLSRDVVSVAVSE